MLFLLQVARVGSNPPHAKGLWVSDVGCREPSPGRNGFSKATNSNLISYFCFSLKPQLRVQMKD